MSMSYLDQGVIEEIERFGESYRADGVVVTDMPLVEICSVIATSGALELEYLLVTSSRKARQIEGGIELVTTAHVEKRQFKQWRDLEIQIGGRGAYDVTASYHWWKEREGNYGPRHESGELDFRFHVNANGRATYVAL